jgi:hypothetical protein
MNFRKQDLNHTGISADLLELLLDQHRQATLPAYQKLWDYYRNSPAPGISSGPLAAGTSSSATRRQRLAQEQGLPPRLTNHNREVVIENDIAWRLHTLVDFMFGKPLSLQSAAPDPQRATLIENFLRSVFDANGGLSFFHDLGLLGCVYGHVDVLLRVDALLNDQNNNNHNHEQTDASDDPIALARLARLFALEIIEAPRAIPLINPDDYRTLDGYVIHHHHWLNQTQPATLLQRVRSNVLGQSQPATRASIARTHLWTTQHELVFESQTADPASSSTNWSASKPATLVAQRDNPLGRVPVVHIQNLPQPYFYEGLSEVQPLIALQDELNTRLSDRANRVTFQSFKMYLGKGIENFTDRPVGPGQMWATDNEHASIVEFGGDAQSPSENAHIQDLRDALDKASGVTAVAAGLLREKVGNLTSENALRIALSGLLAKTQRKRMTYGSGITRLCELILHAADVLNVLPNTPDERRVRIDWPNPLPDSETQRLHDAQLKLNLGVPRKQVLAELGYSDTEAAPAVVN